MKFNQEAGAIISQFDRCLAYIDGSPADVKFPPELIWKIHQKSPGMIWKLAHTHPPGMQDLSQDDTETLKAWAWALHPYPVSMSTITLMSGHIFAETTYTAYIEPKEFWLHRGKGKRAREIEILTEGEVGFSPHLMHFNGPKWLQKLVLRSYEFEAHEEDEE